MIRILDENFNVLQTITRYTSIIFDKKFTDVGSFVLSLTNDFASSYVKKNNYIQYKNNIGIIKTFGKTPQGYTIKGCDIKGLFKQRIVKGEFTGNVETVIKSIVSSNTQGKRSFPNFTVASTSNKGEEVTFSADGILVSDALNTLCQQNNCGWDITLDNKKLVFDVVFPKEKDVSYSVRLQNISDYNYEFDGQNSTNTIYNCVKDNGLELGTWEQKSRDDNINKYVSVKPGWAYFDDGTYLEIEEELRSEIPLGSNDKNYYYLTSNGLLRETSSKYESDSYYYLGEISTDSYVNCTITNYERKTHTFFINDENSGLNREEVYLSKNGLIETILGENSDKLVSDIQNVTAQIIKYDDYGNKWNLGDSVKIKINVFMENIILTVPITAVQIVDEACNKKVLPTFGNVKDSIIKKIIKKERYNI